MSNGQSPVTDAIDSVLNAIPKEGEIQDTSRATEAVRQSQEGPATTFDQYFNRIFPDSAQAPVVAPYSDTEPKAEPEKPLLQRLGAVGRLAQTELNVLRTPFMPLEKRQQIAAEAEKNKEEAWNRVVMRGENFFQGMSKFAEAMGRDPNATVKGALTGMGSTVKEFASGIKNDPTGALNGLANSIVLDPVLDAQVALTGVKFDDPMGVRAANPEEYEHAIFSTAANGAAVAVGGLAHKGIEAIEAIALGQRKLLGTGITSAADLLDLETLPKGVPRHIPTEAFAKAKAPPLIQKFLINQPLILSAAKSSSSGFISGMAYGMVQGAGTDDQASMMLSSGLMFAGFGTGLALVGGGIGAMRGAENVPLSISKMAGELANYRQYKQTVTGLLPQTIERVRILADSPSLNMAILRATKDNEISLIRGVTAAELPLLETEMSTRPFVVNEVGDEVDKNAILVSRVSKRGPPLPEATPHKDLIVKLQKLKNQQAEWDKPGVAVTMTDRVELRNQIDAVQHAVEGDPSHLVMRGQYLRGKIQELSEPLPESAPEELKASREEEMAKFSNEANEISNTVTALSKDRPYLKLRIDKLRRQEGEFSRIYGAEVAKSPTPFEATPESEKINRDWFNTINLRQALETELQFHRPPEGEVLLHDVLIVGSKAPEELTLGGHLAGFENFGYMRNQLVSYRGENYRIVDLHKAATAAEQFEHGKVVGMNVDRVTLTRMDSPKSIKVMLHEISDVPLGDTFASGTSNHKLNYSLKAQILAELYKPGQEYGTFRGQGTSRSITAGDVWRQNQALLRDPETVTGKPLSMTVFRQERGEAISGTGRFYSADINGAMSYAPGGHPLTGGRIPKRANTTLKVHRIDFKNPYIVDGGHRTLINELVDEWINDNVEVKEVGELNNLESSKASTPGLWADRFGRMADSMGKQALDVTFADGVKRRFFSHSLRGSVIEGGSTKRFQAVADLQRGTPERRMLQISNLNHSQLYSWIAEHVGDLTHRMSTNIEHMRGDYENVKDKVNKTLKAIEHKYGVDREIKEQIAANTQAEQARLTKVGVNPEAVSVKGNTVQLTEAGHNYATAHREVMDAAVNHVQRLAAEAAISVGNQNWAVAGNRLRELKSILDQGPEAWERAATEGYNPTGPELPREYKQALAASDVTKRSPGEAGYQLQDKIIKKILTDKGHDGLVYNKLRMHSNTTWNETVEIVDFQGIARRDVARDINTIQYPEPRQNAITGRLYEEFRDIILGKKDDGLIHTLSPAEQARLDQLEKKRSTVIGKDPSGRDITDVLSSEEAQDLTRLTAKKEPLPPVARGRYTELDRIRDKISSLEGMQKTNKFIGNVDAELSMYQKYEADLISGKAENKIIREGIQDTSELGDMLANGKSFHQSVVDFATGKGMEAEVEGLKQEFAKRFATELFDNMDSKDHDVHKSIVQEYGRELEGKIKDQRIDLYKVIDHAQRAGLYLDRAESGHIMLRAVNDNKLVKQVSSLAEAKELITKMGTEKGIEFDGGGNNGPIPPYVMGGELATPMAPLPPNQVPWDPGIVNKGEELMARAYPKLFTTNNKLFLDHDLIYLGKTEFYNHVFREVQRGYDAFTFAMKKAEPMLLKIQARARQFDAERRAQIGAAIESMSPDEVKNLYFRNRQLSAIEIENGEWLADNKVDLREIYDYRAARREATEGMSRSSIEYQNEVLRLKLEAGAHENPVLAEAIDRIDNLKGDKGAAMRLARSKMARDGLGELSRSDYMKENNFGKEERGLVNDIDAAYENLAVTLNIPDGKRLGHYMTHIRLYEEGFFVPSTIREVGSSFGNVDTEFYARMARTGELDVYERDPVIALMRYTRAGTKATHLMPALDQGIKTAEGILKNLPNDGRKVSVRNSLVNFFNDVRSVTPDLDKVVNETLDRYLKKYKIRIDSKALANAIGVTSEASAQAARMVAGVRDFVGNMQVVATEHGVEKLGKFLLYGLRGTEIRGAFQNQRTLLESGVVPERGTLQMENPVERGAQFNPSATVRLANRAADIGLAASLQPKAYRFAHTGVYLTWLKDSDIALAKLNKKILSKDAAYRAVGIDKFELPIRREYDRLVSAGKFDEASVYIGKIAQEQIIGKFGQSNGLHYSGNLAGRVFGQFGTWTAFTARNIGRMVTTGTVGARAGKIARAAAASYILSKVSDETGLNLGNWYIFPGASYFDDNAPFVPTGPGLSPLVQSAQTVIEALNSRGMRQKEAMRKLRQTLPIDPKTGEISIPHLYVPFSYEIGALIDAYHDLKNGKMKQALFRVAGGQAPPKKQGGFGGF